MPAGHVYLVGIADGRLTAPSPLKVGIAHDVNCRVTNLQIGCPFKLKALKTWMFHNIQAARQIEQKFHVRFAEKNVIGEWFDIAVEDAIASLDALTEDFYLRKLPVEEHRKSAIEVLGARVFAAVSPAVSISEGMTASRRQYRRAVAKAPTHGSSS